MKNNQGISSAWGGQRPGSGRPVGSQNPATVELKEWLRNWFASEDGQQTLAEKLRHSDAILIHCLDRAFGKVKHETEMSFRGVSKLSDLSDDDLKKIIALGDNGPLPHR